MPTEQTERRERDRRPWRGRSAMTAAACALVATAGCMGLTSGSKAPAPPPAARISQTPTRDELLAYLNRNAQRLTALETRDLDMDITAGRETIGVGGSLYCQQPRNFRLRAKVVGKEVADVGSNDHEFWYWISENKPPDLYHCSYADLAQGVRLPFPVQPEWVMEALGMARYDASRPTFRAENFSVESRGQSFELIEQTTSPQGQPVKKVTVFNNYNASGTTPQVTALRLYDSGGKLICQATISEVRRDLSGAVIPHKVLFEWPEQKLKMRMTLDGVIVNSPSSDAVQNPRLYARPVLTDIRSFNLARGTYDAPPAPLQRMGGVGR